MKSSESTRCKTCNAQMKIWEHQLSPGLVASLLKFARLVRENGENNVKFSDLVEGESVSFGTNFQKLRYWGLIAHVMEDGNRVGGRWLLTHLGGAFLRGEKLVPSHVRTWGNHIEWKSEVLVGISQFRGKLSDAEEFYQKEFPFELKDIPFQE